MQTLKYSERFIITSLGDYSVGMDSQHIEIDVSTPDLKADSVTASQLTFALKEFLAEFFENGTLTECKTLGENITDWEEITEQQEHEQSCGL